MKERKEIVRYDCAASLVEVTGIEELEDNLPGFAAITEAQRYAEPSWKPYKITVIVEEL